MMGGMRAVLPFLAVLLSTCHPQEVSVTFQCPLSVSGVRLCQYHMSDRHCLYHISMSHVISKQTLPTVLRLTVRDDQVGDAGEGEDEEPHQSFAKTKEFRVGFLYSHLPGPG